MSRPDPVARLHFADSSCLELLEQERWRADPAENSAAADALPLATLLTGSYTYSPAHGRYGLRLARTVAAATGAALEPAPPPPPAGSRETVY